MQKYSIFIGVDMSKQWFDAALYWPGLEGKQPQKQFENGPGGFEHLLHWVGQQSARYRRPGQWYVCMEHTGIYGLALAYFLKDNQTKVVMECPLRISRSLGLKRGKTDAADARDIACYIGVAPFPYQSGTSIRRPDQVSYLANKRIKALISTAVTVALNYDPEYKAFFKKHKALGKDNGWIYNTLKIKMVHRIFAVVKRGTPYVVMNKHQP